MTCIDPFPIACSLWIQHSDYELTEAGLQGFRFGAPAPREGRQYIAGHGAASPYPNRPQKIVASFM